MAVITSANDAAPPVVVAVDLSLNSQQHKAIANSIVCIILPAVFVGLRLLSRRMCNVKFGWDDFFCVVSLVCYLCSVNMKRDLKTDKYWGYAGYIGAVMGCAHFADHQYLLWNGQAYQ